MANPAVSRSPVPKIRFQKISQGQARFEISKITKIMIWARGEPLVVEQSTFLLCCAQCFKDKTWLVEMVYSRSNTFLPAAVGRPSRRNRKSVGSEVVFEGFLEIHMFNLHERPSEQALKYGESSGQ